MKTSHHAVADLLAELLKSCAHCSANFSGHEYALLATSVISNALDSVLREFFETVKDHNWPRLLEFQNWLGNSDNAEVYVIRCSGWKLNLIVIKTYFELFQPSQLLYTEALSPDEGKRLLDVFRTIDWHRF